jgi:hypothetical protein
MTDHEFDVRLEAIARRYNDALGADAARKAAICIMDCWRLTQECIAIAKQPETKRRDTLLRQHLLRLQKRAQSLPIKKPVA